MNEPIRPSHRDNVIFIDRRKVTPSDLRRQAQELIATGRMPSLEELLTVVFEVRRKYVPQIKAARAEGGENSEK